MTDVQYNGDGTYSLALNGPGWDIGLEDGFVSKADILKTGACVSEPELCVLVAGGSAVVIYIGPKLGKVIQDIWRQWSARTPFPYPYRGNDPSIAPGSDWKWHGSGAPQTGKGAWVKEGTKESLHPDLQHPPPYGPHWDYVDQNGKQWRVWPDGTMSKK